MMINDDDDDDDAKAYNRFLMRMHIDEINVTLN